MIKASVIVPVYNVEEYLRECITSIIEQTYSNMEIILVNDGATDTSPTICNEFKAKDDRIVVVNKENGGLSSARNAGIKVAKGEYILFVDGDDSIEKDAVENFVRLATKYNCDVVVGQMNNSEFSDEIFCDKQDELLKFIKNRNLCRVACRYLISREFIKRNNLYFTEGLLHEDEEWTPRMAICVKTFCTNNIPFYNYNRREGSITLSVNYKRELSKLKIAALLHNYAQNDGITDYANQFFESSAYNLIKSTLPVLQKSKLSEYKKVFADNKSLDEILKKYDKKTYWLMKIFGLGGVATIMSLVVNLRK